MLQLVIYYVNQFSYSLKIISKVYENDDNLRIKKISLACRKISELLPFKA